jgi:hypothetical protein
MAGARPQGTKIPQIAIELACCHLVAMTDMKTDLFAKADKLDQGKSAPINVGKNIKAIDMEARQVAILASSDEDRVEIGCTHQAMVTKAIKILQREGVDPNLYRYALDDARALPDHERTRMVIEGEFTEEMIPPKAFKAIIACIMGG